MDLKIFIDGKYILTEKIFNTENEDFMVPFSLLSKLFGQIMYLKETVVN